MDIYFVLVEPAVPENVGSSARAIKTMGFQHLRMVNSKNHLNERAGWLAHGSGDILANAAYFDTLAQALADIDLAIGTTANNKRSAKHDYYNEVELLELIKSKQGNVKKVAVVFGREESGLQNEELRLCDIASTIPLKTTYPTLNLAQAVLVYAHTLSPLHISPSEVLASPTENSSQTKVLKKSVMDLMNALEISSESNLYHRVLERLPRANQEEVNLFLSLLKMMDKKGWMKSK